MVVAAAATAPMLPLIATFPHVDDTRSREALEAVKRARLEGEKKGRAEVEAKIKEIKDRDAKRLADAQGLMDALRDRAWQHEEKQKLEVRVLAGFRGKTANHDGVLRGRVG